MNIIIIGAGVVGISLAKHLSREEHNVIVTDNNAAVIRHLQETMDLQALHGDTSDSDFLQSAGMDKADIVLAVTNSDESNIIITLMARSMNPTARIVARVRKKQFLNNPQLLKVNTLGETSFFSPEHAAVDMVMDLLQIDQAFEVVPFENGSISIVGFRLGEESVLIGRPLSQIQELSNVGALIVAVDKGGEVVIPNGQTILSVTDRVFITTGMKTELPKILHLLGRRPVQHRKIVIAGGGWKGEQIAAKLEKMDVPVHLLEQSLDRCQELAATLDNTIVLHCNATDPEILQKNSQGASTFIAMTGHQEVNLVLCLLARKFGARRAIALMDNEAYITMSPSLGIDAVVSSKQAAVGKILRFLSKGKILDAATMLNGKLDALYMEIQEHSRMVGAPLKSLKIPKTLIVAAAIKKGQMLVPNGNMVLNPGDHVLLIADPAHFKHVDEFLSGK
ncbi:MAG: Trk system potassium transporter TrkA [Magnetococcales bacterium]|nr:Trk system potassium transporter TrkA [Magnetococcales bacterium]MBF0437800.1 Trk system potassium transporter TrkA [Magnetococcales bacterium]